MAAHLVVLSLFLASSQGVEDFIAKDAIEHSTIHDSVGQSHQPNCVGPASPLKALGELFLVGFQPISIGNRLKATSRQLGQGSVMQVPPVEETFDRRTSGSSTDSRTARRFPASPKTRPKATKAQKLRRRVRGTQEAERERELDIFGPNDRQTRRRPRYVDPRNQRDGVSSLGDSDRATFGQAEENDIEEAIDDLRPRGEDFRPKTWNVNVTGTKSAGFFANKDFASLGASEELQAALAKIGITHPSKVQAEGFRPIATGKDVILADQTGSGKTIAYLAPIIQALRMAEESLGRTPRGFVRVLVIVPTSELAMQVLSVAKAISAAGMPVRSSIVTGGHPFITQRRSFEDGLELVVCTPGRLRKHLEGSTPSVSLDQVSHVVLDEADILFEDTDFEETWKVLRDKLPVSAIFNLVTATLPESLVNKVQMEMPLIQVLKGKNLHRTATGVHETIIDCSSGERTRGADDVGFKLKATALLRELANHPADRVLIFCNTIESCRKVENALRRRDRQGRLYELSALHGAIESKQRKRVLAKFTARPDGTPHILVCTDRASRGMDFPDLRHVVLFDFPRDGIEYVRRVGRATRGTGTPGRVTSLVLGRQLRYARELMKTNREGGMVNVETFA